MYNAKSDVVRLSLPGPCRNTQDLEASCYYSSKSSQSGASVADQVAQDIALHLNEEGIFRKHNEFAMIVERCCTTSVQNA